MAASLLNFLAVTCAIVAVGVPEAGAQAPVTKPEALIPESVLAGGTILASDVQDTVASEAAPASALGRTADRFSADAVPNTTLLTKDGQPCVPGADVPLEQGIAACRAVDLREFPRRDDGEGDLRSEDHTYTVYSCHPDTGWGNYSMGGVAGPYMEAWNECAWQAGLRAKAAYGPFPDTPQWVGAEWIMLAPPGAAVIGYSVSLWCRAFYGWGATMMVGTYEWGYSYDPIQACYTPAGGTMPDGWYLDDYGTDLDREYPGIKLSFHCAFWSSCSHVAAGTYGMGSWIRNIEVTMRDTSPPAPPAVWGSLWGQQWIRDGVHTLGFNAPDAGSGIERVEFNVDGGFVWEQRQGCNFAYTSPCPTGLYGGYGVVDVGELEEGTHTAQFFAEDAGGWVSSTSTTLNVDNTPPGPPTDVKIEADPGLAPGGPTLSWTNPPGDGAAPVDVACYKLGSPPASESDYTECRDMPDGEVRSTMSGVSAQEPPVSIYVWVKDKAGNAGEARRATGIGFV